MSDKARSVSRGRENLQSSGRGGLGNIRSTSRGVSGIDIAEGPDDFSATRGREKPVDGTKIHSTGRGGAGNIRSPSRDATKGEDYEGKDYEIKVIREHAAAEEGAVRSSGRGGLGNISRSRSRDVESRASATYQSTGRGGAGNLTTHSVRDSSIDEEAERRAYARPEGIHSTGRGGVANLTEGHAGIEEVEHHLSADTMASTGRGGAGNIRNRSASREHNRGASKERNVISSLIDKVTHPHGKPTEQSVPEE